MPNRLARTSFANLVACFPERPVGDLRSLQKKTLQETGKTWLEMGAMWHWRADDLFSYVNGVSGEDVLVGAMQRGKGVVLALPHLGAWELAALYCGARYPMTTLYRQPRVPRIEAWLRDARERTGAKLVAAGNGGIRSALRALQRNELVCVLPDQEPKHGSGEFAPFFGIQALTMTLFSRLVRYRDAEVVFAFAERLPLGRGYRLVFLPAPPGVHDPDPVRAATALNQGIEACVRRCPSQYHWTYRRFRARPPGAPRIY